MAETWYVWKYLRVGKVKHQFYTISRSSSVCGVNIYWMTSEQWRSDKEGLDKRRPCRKCARMTER